MLSSKKITELASSEALKIAEDLARKVPLYPQGSKAQQDEIEQDRSFIKEGLLLCLTSMNALNEKKEILRRFIAILDQKAPSLAKENDLSAIKVELIQKEVLMDILIQAMRIKTKKDGSLEGLVNSLKEAEIKGAQAEILRLKEELANINPEALPPGVKAFQTPKF